jgi:5-methylthioadenosine/S-adenosylhomocysteine deaminase
MVQQTGFERREPTRVDLIIRGGTVITMDPERRIIRDGAVCIQGSRIAAVGDSHDLLTRFTASERIDAVGKIVIPGLINTHTHLFQTFVRGIGQDLPAIEWLHQAIDPIVGRLSLEDAYLSTLLGCLEAVKSGTTCILEYNYANPLPGIADETIRAFQEIGIRGILARGILDTGDLHSDIIQDTDAELAECERLITRWDGTYEGMVSIWIAPYTIMSATADAFKGARSLADRHHVWLTVHAATPSTIEAAVAQYGMGDLRWEEKIGFLGPDVLLVHCCGDLTEGDLDLIATLGAKVSHNPVSNCYLGEGIAPISEMVQRGIPVGLGTDGPSSNNNMDMLATIKIASLLQKVKHLNPSALSADKVLEMATIEGARTVGMETEIGSIETGKRADLVVVDLWHPNCIAVHDPIASLVYSATQESIDTVVINGRVVVQNRGLQTVDEEEILRRSQKVAQRLIARAGINP